MLKDALREVDRSAARAAATGADLGADYLKSVLVKLYTTGDARALLPVVARVLHFGPADVAACTAALDEREGGKGVAGALAWLGVGGGG